MKFAIECYSCLSDRYQYVTYNGTESAKQNIKCGVPQGSILGPLLFLIYINDLANVCEYMMPLLFADDTNLFRGGKNIDDIHNEISHDLDSLSEWLKSNKLSLNIKKTISLYLQGMGPLSHMLTYVLMDTILVK